MGAFTGLVTYKSQLVGEGEAKYKSFKPWKYGMQHRRTSTSQEYSASYLQIYFTFNLKLIFSKKSNELLMNSPI